MNIARFVFLVNVLTSIFFLYKIDSAVHGFFANINIEFDFLSVILMMILKSESFCNFFDHSIKACATIIQGIF